VLVIGRRCLTKSTSRPVLGSGTGTCAGSDTASSSLSSASNSGNGGSGGGNGSSDGDDDVADVDDGTSADVTVS
jgi:hypothetical protein